MNSCDDRAVYWFYKECSEACGIVSTRDIKEDFTRLASEAGQRSRIAKLDGRHHNGGYESAN